MCIAMLSSSPASAGTVALVPIGEAAKALADETRAVITGVAGVKLMAAAATADEVRNAAEAGLSCGPDYDECLAKLAVFLNVDRVVVLGAAGTPAGLEMELVVVEAALGRRTASAKLIVPDGEQRALAIEDAVLLALAPEKHFGQLIVNAAPAGRVVVDGTVVGDAAPRLALPLRSGKHELVVEREGFVPYRETVDVQAGRQLLVDAKLAAAAAAAGTGNGNGNATVPPAAGPASGLMTAGVVAASTGGAILVIGGGTALVIDLLLTTTSTGNFDERQTMLELERVGAVVGAIGGAVAVGGGIACVLALNGAAPAAAAGEP